MKKILYALIAVLTIDLLAITSNSRFQKNEISSIRINEVKLMEDKNAELLFLYFEIVNQGIKHPDIVLAQAILESGYLSSQIFRENNNLFGMRFPERRKTVATSENKGYSVYDCWTDSVEDYKLFQDFLFRRKEKTRDEYFNFLHRIYAENKTYVFYLKKVINQNQHIINNDYELYKKFKENQKYSDYEKKLCELIDNRKIV